MAKIGEDKLIELKSYVKGLQDATKMFCDSIQQISIDPSVTQVHEDGMCEKCKTCMHKEKYQDDTPCCDCDPKNGAEMYEPEAKEDKSLQLDGDPIFYRYDSKYKMFRPAKLNEFRDGEMVYSSPNHVIGFVYSGKIKRWPV